MKKTICAVLCTALCCAGLAGCGQQETPDVPKPWAATGEAVQTAAQIETTQRGELSTLAMLDSDDASITLPVGVTVQDVTQLQKVIWRAFFFRDADFHTAEAADVLPYLTDGATPWGLQYIYDTYDPAHLHGEYEQLSVESDPDPLERFPDVYYRVDGSVMDFLMNGVFGVEPDETLQTDGAYCADGVWYFNSLATGMTTNETVLHAWQTIGENHFRLTVELLQADAEGEMTHERSAFIDVRRTDEDGVRVWQVMKIETFE